VYIKNAHPEYIEGQIRLLYVVHTTLICDKVYSTCTVILGQATQSLRTRGQLIRLERYKTVYYI